MQFQVQTICGAGEWNDAGDACVKCGCSINATMSAEVAKIILWKLKQNVIKASPQFLIAQKQLGIDQICWFFQYTSLFDALHKFRFHIRDKESAVAIYDSMVLPFDPHKHSLLTLIENGKSATENDGFVFCMSIDQFDALTGDAVSQAAASVPSSKDGRTNEDKVSSVKRAHMAQSWSAIGCIRYADYVQMESEHMCTSNVDKQEHATKNIQESVAKISSTMRVRGSASNQCFRLHDLFTGVEK
jgi:hypothetical protein